MQTNSMIWENELPSTLSAVQFSALQATFTDCYAFKLDVVQKYYFSLFL